MKKTIAFILVGMLFFLYGCDLTRNQNIPIEVGYTVGGGNALDYPGFLAFNINNSVGNSDDPVNILFEYGHDYDFEQYSSFDLIHTIVVYVSSSTVNHNRDDEAYTMLYDSKLDDFMTEDYRCIVNWSDMFSKVVFNKSFELSIAPDDVPYEKGMLYFVMYKGDFEPGQESILPRVYRVIYFINIDGVLTFTKDNPF